MEENIEKNPSDFDPYIKDRDQKAYQIERLLTHLFWIDEGVLTALDALKTKDLPAIADELDNAKDSIRQFRGHLARLCQLLNLPADYESVKRLAEVKKI